MTVAALIVACLALAASLLTAAALVEAYEAIERLTGYRGIRGQLQQFEVDHLVGARPSEYGLPAALDTGSGAVLLLSPTCATCHHLAKEFNGAIPEGIHVLVTNSPSNVAHDWVQKYRLPLSSCTVDTDRVIADNLGIDTSPVALITEDGRFSRAVVVQSVEALVGSFEPAA